MTATNSTQDPRIVVRLEGEYYDCKTLIVDLSQIPEKYRVHIGNRTMQLHLWYDYRITTRSWDGIILNGVTSSGTRLDRYIPSLLTTFVSQMWTQQIIESEEISLEVLDCEGLEPEWIDETLQKSLIDTIQDTYDELFKAPHRDLVNTLRLLDNKTKIDEGLFSSLREGLDKLENLARLINAPQDKLEATS